MPRAQYRVTQREFKIEEYDEDGYATGREVGFGETFWADGDEHVVTVNGLERRHQLHPEWWLEAGLVEPVEQKAPKPDPKDKPGAGDKL